MNQKDSASLWNGPAPEFGGETVEASSGRLHCAPPPLLGVEFSPLPMPLEATCRRFTDE